MERILNLVDKQGHGTIINITGLGGVGKTALAREVIARNPDGSLTPCWISFHRPLSAPFDAIEILSKNLKEGSQLLVVLDGVDSKPTINEWLRAIFNKHAIKAVLVTSRAFIPLRAHDIHLAPFTNEEGRRFLRERLAFEKMPVSEQLCDLLMAKSAGLPLALNLLVGLAKGRSLAEIARLDGSVYDLKGPEQSRIIRAVRPQIIRVSGALIERIKKDPEKMHDITSRQFEQLIAEIFDAQGFEVELTQATWDGGRDILARLNTGVLKFLCLIETKKYGKDQPVGVRLVRHLYGTFCDEQANSAMLVTTSYFTEQAKEFTTRHKYQLSLKDYTDVVTWVMDYKGNKVRA